jgi:type II secretory pathway pseudopilin PulG
MPLGPGADGPTARRSASAPTHRPPWLLLLSSITLVYGGLLLVSGLIALRNPASAAKFPIARPLAPEEEAMTRELIAVNTDIVARHAGAIRARAGASTLLALLMLYAAAAALSRDRNGRAATLIAAWLGIVYQVASLPMLIPIAEDYATTSAPILARMVASDLPATTTTATADGGAGAADAGATATTPAPPAPGGGEAPRPEAIAGFMHSVFLGVPIATAILGIMGSLLLIQYFGGRRGRELYGLMPPPRPHD